jgi:hypothetical protein
MFPALGTSQTLNEPAAPSFLAALTEPRKRNDSGNGLLAICDAKMYHMKKASIRDLRYRFCVVENLLRDGHEIQITKRKRVNRSSPTS